jgi:sec-independent protein translocase protein TatB
MPPAWPNEPQLDTAVFDVGFWEILIIMVVALLVVGPERLPRLARTVGLWVGKARGFVRSVKEEIDREIATDELRRTLAKQAEMPELQELMDDIKKDSSKKAGPVRRVTKGEDQPEPLVRAAKDDTPKDDKAKAEKREAAAHKPSAAESASRPHDGST